MREELVHIVVLGGGGAMGRITVRALVEDKRVTRVTVADARPAAAERALAWLNKGRDKAAAAACDVRDADGLAALLHGSDSVVNATDYTFNLEVMRAALSAHVPYADLGGLFHMTRRQYELDAAFRAAGLTAVLGIGSTPGITNLLAAIAVESLDRVERLDVRIGCSDGSVAGDTFVAPYSIRTIFDECTLQPMVYRAGRWSPVAPMSGQEEVDFPAPVGRAVAMHTLHSEVALFPTSYRDRGLRHVSFKIAFPEAFLAQLKLLVHMGLASTNPVSVHGPAGAVEVAPRELAVALLATQSAPGAGELADCDVLRVVARGTRDERTVELVEEVVALPYKPWAAAAGDVDTGVPLAIAGILLASGAVLSTGAVGAELAFDPHVFLRELQVFGLRARETVTRSLS